MKRLFLVALLGLMTIVAQAQRVTDKLDRGLVAMKAGGGVYLSWRMFGEEYYDVTKWAFNDHELIIPTRVQVRFTPLKDLSVFLYTGPSFDIGLAYTESIDYKNSSKKYKATVDLYSGRAKNSNSDIKVDNSTNARDERKLFSRFHMMWGFGGGVQWKNLRLDMYADWGISDSFSEANRESNGEPLKLNRPFAIQLTYMF